MTPLVLRDLHWMPILFRAQFKVLALTLKALKGWGHRFLQEGRCRDQPTQVLQSAREAQLTVPSVTEARLGVTRNRAFLLAAPLWWNSTPLRSA